MELLSLRSMVLSQFTSVALNQDVACFRMVSQKTDCLPFVTVTWISESSLIAAVSYKIILFTILYVQVFYSQILRLQ